MRAKAGKTLIKSDVFLGLIVAFTLTSLAVLANSAWLFNPYGWVDHWGYLGHSLSLTELRAAFPNEPSGDLLPVIWPAALLQLLFADAVVAYLHGALSFFLTTFLLFQIARKNFDKEVALFVSTMWLGSQYVLTSLGASYPTGSVILYLSLTLYFLQKSQNLGSIVNWNLAFASIFFTLALYSAILSIIYLPGLILFYLLYTQEKNPKDKLMVVKNLITFVSSFLITTLILQLFYLQYGNGFFFANNLNKLVSFTAGNAYRAPAFSQWLPTATWLVLPFLICGFAAIMLIQRGSLQKLPHHYLAFIALPIATFVLQVSVNLFLHQWSLQFLYFNQSLGLYFASLGVCIATFFKLFSKKYQVKLIYVSLLLSIFSILLTNYKFYNVMTLAEKIPFGEYFLSHPLRSSLIIISILLVVMFRGQFIKIFSLFSLCALVSINIFSFSPSYGCFMCADVIARQGIWAGVKDMKQNQISTITVSKVVSDLDSRRDFKIWYDENEPLGPVFRQINSIVYLNVQENRVNKAFPALSEAIQPIGSEGRGLVSGDRILVLSSQNQAATQLIKELKMNNVVTSKIQREDVMFDKLTLIQILTFTVK